MDPAYHQALLAQGETSTLSSSPRCAALLARADALISDHGLHVMQPLLGLSDLKFFDVWHGIPFKGFDADDFRVQHRYDEIWVASPLHKQLYVDRYGFEADKVQVTGYARTDCLVAGVETENQLLSRFGLDATRGRKRVLFAPTWKQDASGRSLFPFGVEAKTFFAGLDSVCRRTGAALLFRAHLNSAEGSSLVAGGSVIPVPFSDYPDSEGLLQLSDVLVCDWSSIAFDYLLLNRPTIFLDVPPPFAKGFSLGPEYRFGAVAPDMPTLLDQLERALSDPAGYHLEFAARHADIRAQVYGQFADGHAADRCVARLRHALAQ
jgi:CDP-glycerol glycerophosphotransferase